MGDAYVFFLKLRARAGSAVLRAAQGHPSFIRIVGYSTALISAAVVLWKYWDELDCYLLAFGQDATRQLAIAIGAAITGLVAIVFSLTLFTVQRAADKGTPTIFEEFARDLWLWIIYWLLALSAVACFILGLFPIRHSSVTLVAVCEFSLILATFILLRVHFHRAIQLVTGRGMINRYHKRGVKQLKRVKKLEDVVVKTGFIPPANPRDPKNG
jgi:uncharacterized membrane protein